MSDDMDAESADLARRMMQDDLANGGDPNAWAGGWKPGPESFTEDVRESAAREDAERLGMDAGGKPFTPEQLKQFSEQMGSYTNALSRSAVAGRGFLSPAIAAAAPGIGSAIHAAMDAEAAKARQDRAAGAKGVSGDRIVIDEAIELALKPGALPEPFGPLNLTEWTSAMLADWQDATITSEELLTLLDEMLDRTLHSEACHIDPDDTTCLCVIGQLRAVLPPCTVEYPLVPDDAKLWHCTRKAHPASPERHVWSNR